jgi:hypothetical protein
MTSALHGGEWSVSHPGCALAPGKEPPVPTGQEAVWANLIKSITNNKIQKQKLKVVSMEQFKVKSEA